MEEEHQGEIGAMWLCHAFFVVERGARVLFDPVFSDRRSPSRFSNVHPELPCKIEDVPEADEGIISRNHCEQYAPLGMVDILTLVAWRYLRKNEKMDVLKMVHVSAMEIAGFCP
ncbi:hypothetical protein EDD85DRAFT_794089 [Armillaria nabsnona]|nr:hypothetical protein EDD85DRAFT_794089 [Armillaria nabsnona]